MIHLSVAVGKFVETLLWGMFRAGFVLGVAGAAILIAVLVLVVLVRRVARRRR